MCWGGAVLLTLLLYSWWKASEDYICYKFEFFPILFSIKKTLAAAPTVESRGESQLCFKACAPLSGRSR